MGRIVYVFSIMGVLAFALYMVILNLVATNEARSLYEEIKKEQPEIFQGLSAPIIYKCINERHIRDSNRLLNVCIKYFVDSGYNDIEQKRRNSYFIESGRAPYKLKDHIE